LNSCGAASANTIAAYKKEADTLRSENSALQTTAYASPRSKAAQAADRRVQELEQQQNESVARVEELEKEAVEREEYWKRKLDAELRARETNWIAEKEQLSNDRESTFYPDLSS
jgi:serine protease inhibitor ecotin